MFLKIYEITKHTFTSPAKRNSYYFYNSLNFQILIKQLRLRINNNAGRGGRGRIIIRTKGPLLIINKKYQINNSFRYLKIGIISSFSLIPFKNKILSLIIFSNGACSYFQASDNFKLFSIFFYNLNKKFKKINFFRIHLMLTQIKKLSFISCLELLPGSGSQYSRSTGVKSKIIKFDPTTHSTLIQLPSGIKKIFSYYSFVLLGKVANSLHKKCFNHKSGYWRSFGVKPVVRGVAKNPIDHPHGGRTKAIKHQQTPWGKPTKLK